MGDIVFGVLTISDTCHNDAAKDKSGPRLVQLLRESFENAKIVTDILPDEREVIEAKLRLWIKQLQPQHISAIITTGGTGFAPRDVTPEATKPLIDKDCPQLTLAIALASLQKTKFAALSRGICGISGRTLIMNFTGSEKAVIECFDVVRDILPHALQLINNDLHLVRKVHAQIQGSNNASRGHICPHKTGANDGVDRNSPYPMLPVTEALDVILKSVRPHDQAYLLEHVTSPIDIPPFRASIKDGYAMSSAGFSGTKKVVGYIAAGDIISTYELQADECFKINTGAAIPLHADSVVQVEDTKLLRTNKKGEEDLVEILVEPLANMDIRPIGCDLKKGEKVFPSLDHSPVVYKSILASIGELASGYKPSIAIISTGSELLAPGNSTATEKSLIYDSNTTMLEQLLIYFGFECAKKVVLCDKFNEVKQCLSDIWQEVDFVICSGGVSMGDKDYIQPALKQNGFDLKFGRVCMKPGKPMTFAAQTDKEHYFFGLPGNPVSAFVTFHLFVLPALRWRMGWPRDKCTLPKIQVTLENDKVALDPRPEYMRASITCKNGKFYARITGEQMSSRLQSIVGADVLVHMPARTENKSYSLAGDLLAAFVLRYDFISKYE